MQAVRWEDIPKASRELILRAFIFVVNKYDPDGNFLKAKARYVVNGKTQHDSTYGWTSPGGSETTSVCFIRYGLCNGVI